MQLFHVEQPQRNVHPVQNLLLCTTFHQNRMIFTEIWRYNDFRRYGGGPK